MRLQKIHRVIPLLGALMLANLTFAKLNIVASVPDLGDMAREIGGKYVKVVVLATGKEDLHAVPARPSFLPKLNRADLLFSLGLDAEHAWLPALVAEARNSDILPGKKGWVTTYAGIEVLEKPVRLDRSEGEQHPLGNPHYNIGPQCGKIMARHVGEALMNADPKHAEEYKKNMQAYLKKITDLEVRLLEKGKALKGVKIVEYHPDIAYLCEFYGLEIAGSIEAKPGVPPTASHMAELSENAKKAGVKLIIHNQSQNPALPEKLSKALQARKVEIANSAGANDEAGTWMELQEYNLKQLLKALEG